MAQNFDMDKWRPFFFHPISILLDKRSTKKRLLYQNHITYSVRQRLKHFWMDEKCLRIKKITRVSFSRFPTKKKYIWTFRSICSDVRSDFAIHSLTIFVKLFCNQKKKKRLGPIWKNKHRTIKSETNTFRFTITLRFRKMITLEAFWNFFLLLLFVCFQDYVMLFFTPFFQHFFIDSIELFQARGFDQI